MYNFNWLTKRKSSRYETKCQQWGSIPDRNQSIEKLASNEFDILIIGGGSTGAGAALDAATRGLRTACVEREDFASGTSSRSTKLLWGGSRYLVQALTSLFGPNIILKPFTTIEKFKADFKMVLNCHRERSFLLLSQPHLTYWMPIAVPLTHWLIWPPPFGYYPAMFGPLGLFPAFFKFYDSLSGFSSPHSYIMTPVQARRKFPQLNNEEIKYSSVFYEGMHDDARTNLAIAMTAAANGAAIANYCEVVELLYETPKSISNRVIGATVCDRLTGRRFDVYAKSVLICGGPFTDQLRRMECDNSADTSFVPAVTGASGIHIVLPSYYAPESFGFVDMNTSDGRFLFFLPWEGHVVIGTTDRKCNPLDNRPEPSEEDIQWLLNEAGKFLSPELKIERKSVLSAWSGIRPLATDPNAAAGSTASMSRDHVVSHNKETGVVFVAGGKWTTYREMAEDAVDKVLEVTGLGWSGECSVGPCRTLEVGLVGKQGYSENLAAALLDDYGAALNPAISKHLVRAFGGRARDVLQTSLEATSGSEDGAKDLSVQALQPLLEPLVEGFPYLEAEVVYAARHEYAVRAEDVLARRTRLAFLNRKLVENSTYSEASLTKIGLAVHREAALVAIPRIVELMGAELQWSPERAAKEVRDCVHFMRHFGGSKPLLESAGPRKKKSLNELQEVISRLRNKSNYFPASQLVLVSELLDHVMTDDETKDCLARCTPVIFRDVVIQAGEAQLVGRNVSAEMFLEWWNRDC